MGVAPAASAATTRYASSVGSGLAPCLEASPCQIPTALALSTSGDKLVIKPGPAFISPGPLSVIAPNLEIVGEGSPKPVLQFIVPAAVPGFGGLTLGPPAAGGKLRNVHIEVLGGGPGLYADAANMTISDVSVNASGPPGTSVLVNGAGTTIDRLTTSGTGSVALNQGSIFPPTGTVTLRRSRLGGSPVALTTRSNTTTVNSVVSDTLVQSGGAGAMAIASSGGKYRNVTAIASGPGSRGLAAVASIAITGPPGPTSVKNSILRANGGVTDVAVDVAPPLPSYCSTTPWLPECTTALVSGSLAVDHSNFRTQGGTLAAGSGANTADDPQFVDAAASDYRLKPGSPAIDAGVDDADNGTLDLDGKQRKLGAAVDLGAFEADPPPAQTTPGGGSETTTQPEVVAPVVDRTVPALSALALTNRKFAVARGSTPVTARAKKGTTFVFTLSEPAATTITIERAQSGRRKGRSCVKPTRRNRKAKKCTRYVKVGALQRGGALGANAVPFTGRIGKKALKPASYRAVMTATDAAGNKSNARAIAFKVVRR